MVDHLLTNRSINNFEIWDHSCSVGMDGGYSLNCGSLLRYVDNDGKFITSADHGHKFGLPDVYDAQDKIGCRIKGKLIESVEINKATADLTLFLDDARLELLCSSVGYENWQLYGPDGFVVVDRECRHKVDQ
jgi:hypothetical protein